MTLRARVAAAAAAAIVLAVLLLVIAVPALLADDLRGELDDSLRRRAADVARLNATVPGQLTEVGRDRGRRVARAGRGPDRADRRAVVRARRARAAGRRARPARPPAAARGRTARHRPDPGVHGAAGRARRGRGLRRGRRRRVRPRGGRTHRRPRPGADRGLRAARRAARRRARDLAHAPRAASAHAPVGRSAGDRPRRRHLPPPAGTADDDEVGELAHTLNAMLASLERAQEAEHRFVGDASHELRTPLTALRGNAAYLAKHGPDEAVIQDITDGAERLSALLDDLLALAREDAAAPLQAEPVRLADLAPDAHVEQDVWTSGERDALQRAVDNLVRNAHKHGTGTVTVTVGGDGTDAFIAVEDEGPGPDDPTASSSASTAAAAPAAKAPASASRSSRRSPSVTAAGSKSTARALRSLSKNSQSPPVELDRNETTPHRLHPPPVADRRRARRRRDRRRDRPGRTHHRREARAQVAGPRALRRRERQARRGRDRAHQVHQQPPPLRLAARGHRLPRPHRRQRAAVALQRRQAAAGAAVGQRRRADRRRRRALPDL